MSDSFSQSVEEDHRGEMRGKVSHVWHGRDGVSSTSEEVAAHLSSGCLPVF